MSTPLVRIRHFGVEYPGAAQPAVEGLELEIAAGEIVCLVGESGSGKSTTAAALAGLLPESARLHGQLWLQGQALDSLDERAWRQRRGRLVGFVPQDPGTSLDPVKTIGAQVVEAMTVHGVAVTEARPRALQLLREVGLKAPETLLARYPHQLSGGMCQRVLIAIALANDPPLLIADEPTSALDVSVQRQILDRLQVLVRERGSSLLLITHDLAVALDRADRILVMRHGRLLESGTPAQLWHAPQHPYTRQLLQASPLTRLQQRRAAPAPGREAPLLQVTSLDRRFARHGPAAVDGVSFSLQRGTTTSLVGESGSGKSTTARIILALEQASSGSVRFDGLEVLGARRRELHGYRRRVQLVYQNPWAALDPRHDLLAIISEPLRAFGIGQRRDDRARVLELLERVGLPGELLHRRPAQLSGGQRQRVAIARALAVQPELLVLDEPLSALDAPVQAQVLELLQRLQRELGLTYLFISHDLATVRGISDQVLVMHQGRLVDQGATEEVFGRPGSEYTRRLLEDMPGQLVPQVLPQVQVAGR
ncbi:ABC transporter ATP-binding protein [Pseudomonas sp. 148P]|uniref:ABC transporter ATP-binding protein n=1 Tax=Pseudomonas ulcerans TaxID=3115852 RepID=A0ABU7I1I3_9PSED|nr:MULTISPECIES: ABC transporter ATP-binding protein [unclassified Pseudomonas]MEE1926426.1 ABC transporter ATP-binding protein [Pseudomonas sp. 147P]MEE1937673.1 ABC transporter ATP-binding protein [Pseudomonas sp. 148P]